MKSAAIVIAFTAGLVAAASCLVDRRSGDYTCSNDTDCAQFPDARICDTASGFCVPQECPSVCNAGCDIKAKTCRTSCPGPGCSGTLACPDGYTCNITCSSGNACSNIDCSNAVACTIGCTAGNACDNIDCNGPGHPSCTVTCSGANACGNITCDTARCQIGCNGGNACGNLACAESCSCTATCSTASACGTVTCPTGCTSGTGCGGCNTCGN